VVGISKRNRFRVKIFVKNEWPITITDISYYLAYMSKQGFVYSTVRSYVAE
jgi:hypothetical protein